MTDQVVDKSCWRSLKAMHEHYLAHTPLDDGRSAAELIASYTEQKRLQCSFHQMRNARPWAKPQSDLVLLEQLKTFDKEIEQIRADVQQKMMSDASDGNWVAVGRRNPDVGHELIPPHYWSFLRLDLDQGAVTGESLSYYDLLCAITRDVPENHPILATIRIAQKDVGAERHGASTTEPRLFNAPLISPADSQEIVRTGAPGRPTSMHLVKMEFERRCRESEVILSSVKTEAEHLAAWLESNHPNVPRPTAGTIENNIRGAHRKVKCPPGNPTK